MKANWKDWYRDFWLLVITAGLLITASYLVSEIKEQREGRKVGTTITCVINSSILQGSHSFIVASASQPLPEKVEQRLIHEGYPDKVAREHGAITQADAYIKAISDAVIKAVGSKARGLIVESAPTHGKSGKPAGSINCSQLKTLTKAH